MIDHSKTECLASSVLNVTTMCKISGLKMTQIVLKLLQNVLVVVIFCIAALFLFFLISESFIREGMPLGLAHQAQSEAIINIAFFAVFPYASLLSGYASAKECLLKLNVKYLAQNPMFLIGPVMIAWIGPSAIPLACAYSGLAFFSQFATTMFRPPPPMSLQNTYLDPRFTALEPGEPTDPPPIKPIAFTWARWALDCVSLLLIIAPTTIVLAAIASFALLGSILLPQSGTRPSFESAGMRIIAAASFVIPLAIVGWSVLRPALYARKILARARKLVRGASAPGEKTALYLRQFARDQKSEVTRPRSIPMRVMCSLPGLAIPVGSATRLRLEDTIAQVFDGILAFIAPGTPGEIIPPLGADRFYLDVADWKQEITSKIRKSDVLIMLVEFSASTAWEIEELLRDENRCRTVLCLPEPGRSPSWSDQWKSMQSKGRPLPDVDEASAVVVFPDINSQTVIRVRGHWGFWGDALRSAIVSGLIGERGKPELEFGTRLPSGEAILKWSASFFLITFMIGYLLPLLAIDLLELTGFSLFDPLIWIVLKFIA